MFFIIVFLFTFALNGYVFIRGWQLLPPFFIIRLVYSLLFTFLFSLFFIRMIYGRGSFSPSALFLNELAFTWLIVVIYLALIALFVDLVRLANLAGGFFLSFISDNPLKWARITGMTSMLIVAGLLLYGSYSFNNPRITSYTVELDKSLPNGGLTLALVSDIHLGYSINETHLEKYTDLINSLDADLVFITGDIADRTLAPLERWRAGEHFASIKFKYGVYAVSGNHEFYGGEREEIYEYLRSHGVNLLLDTVVNVAGVNIAGRDDITNKGRKPLSEILHPTDNLTPLILLDHQPYNLEEAVMNNVDLQLSGHTHNGQFWPGNLIVSWMYELSYGFMKNGNTNFIVTSGAGLWGPKFRIGTISEVVKIELKGK
jgi:uncharacterized protein